MLRKTLNFLVLALFLSAGNAVAQNVGNDLDGDPDNPNTRVGTRGANFLEIPIGARAQALGGAGATLQGGIFAMYWNPAAIATTEGFSVGFAYSELFDELNIDYFYTGGLLNFLGGVIGINFASLESGDITRTTEEFPEGGDPVFGSIFDWTSQFVGGYYARPITDRLNVGAGLKFISEGIDDASADWVAFDAGVTFRTGLLGIELGAVAQNLGSSSRFEGTAVERVLAGNQQLFPPNARNVEAQFNTQELDLPSLFRFTVLLDVLGSPESLIQTPGQIHGLDVAVDLTDATDTDVQTSIGFEYNFRQIAFARIGKRFFNEDQRTGDIQSGVGAAGTFFRQDEFRDFDHGLSFGGGIRLPVLGRAIAFDYAYVDMGELENIQTLSFEFGL